MSTGKEKIMANFNKNGNNENNENQNQNLVMDWKLCSFECKEIKNGVMLRCTKNAGKREDGSWKPSMNVAVFCSFDKCEIEEDDYNGCNVLVSGQFGVDEYVDNNGNSHLSFKIFATKVAKL